MSRRNMVAGVFMPGPRIRAYRRCPCGQLFALLAVPGHPPAVCSFHRRPDGDYRALRAAVATKTGR